MSKFYIPANFGRNQVIGSGDIEHNITFWSKLSVFLSAVTLKIRSRPQRPYQFSIINKCCIHADFSSNLLMCSEDIEQSITFWSKLSMFFVCSDLEN